MSRLRDHRVRMDTSWCPDPDGCARLFHGDLSSGLAMSDTCKCCGQPITEPDPPAPYWPSLRRAAAGAYFAVGADGTRLYAVRTYEEDGSAERADGTILRGMWWEVSTTPQSGPPPETVDRDRDGRIRGVYVKGGNGWHALGDTRVFEDTLAGPYRTKREAVQALADYVNREPGR